MGNKDNGARPRNAFKFGVETSDGLFLGWQAISKLRAPIWDDKRFKRYIPLIPEKPEQYINGDPSRPNIHYSGQFAVWRVKVDAKKAKFLQALENTYPGARLVLMYSADGRNWYKEEPGQNLEQWAGYVNRVILWRDRENMLRALVGVKLKS